MITFYHFEFSRYGQLFLYFLSYWFFHYIYSSLVILTLLQWSIWEVIDVTMYCTFTFFDEIKWRCYHYYIINFFWVLSIIFWWKINIYEEITTFDECYPFVLNLFINSMQLFQYTYLQLIWMFHFVILKLWSKWNMRTIEINEIIIIMAVITRKQKLTL